MASCLWRRAGAGPNLHWERGLAVQVRLPAMSADLYWPPRPWRVWLPELVLAGVLGFVFLPFVLGLPVAALVDSLLFAWMRMWRRLRNCGRSRYRRRPGSCRVAVIGAGWSGLAIAARLRELGVPFEGFEADDDVGGTWHPSRRYADLTMHAPAYGASFAGFPWPSPDERPTGEEVQQYMRRFAESKDLLRSYSFSTSVSGVDHRSYSRTATLTVKRRSGRGEEKEASAGEAQSEQQAEMGPFDLVIFASLAAQPAVPTMPGHFQGRSCHSSQATSETVAAIAEEGERVVVVGAGKSSCDVVLALRRAGVAAEKLTWLHRRPYHFFKYERCLSRRSAQLEGSVWPRLRSCVAFVALLISAIFPRLSWRMMWSLDFAYTPHESTHGDGPTGDTSKGQQSKWARDPTFRMGLLDAERRRGLAQDAAAIQRHGEPVRLEAGAIALASGERIKADTLIWATGYRTGISSLALSTDGGPSAVLAADVPLFQHILPVTFPVLALSSHFFTAPGPAAAREATEYLVYHMCVRPPVSRERMEQEAAALWCRQSVSRHILFSPGFWQNLVLIQLDLWLVGILPMSFGLRRLADLYVFNRLEPRELGLLPDMVKERWDDGAAPSWWRGLCSVGRARQEAPLRTARDEDSGV